MEGLVFGGAYLRREICVSKSIGLALLLEVNLLFLLCFTLYLRAIFQVYLEGRFNRGFVALRVGGRLIHGGAFFRNFMVIVPNMTSLDSELLAFLVMCQERGTFYST